MTIEFIGYISTRESSEIIPASGPVIDIDHVETVARAHEASGFDRALVAFHSTSPESILVASHAASVTSKLGLMIAHRPGFTQPTLAARQFATLDQFTGGRVAVHIITGGDDAEQRQDGDFLTKDERYARTGEYLDVVRRVWTSDQPFDHDGRFYRFERAFSTVKPVQKPHIPIYFGGASDAAIPVAGQYADIYALWGETHDQVRELTGRVRAAAAQHGRKPRFSLSLRPILADTEEQAWKRADEILERARALADKTGFTRSKEPVNSGSLRLLEAAAKGSRLDKRLWTGIAALTGARGNSTSLVGTPEQVADALVDYYDLGVTTFLIRGFEPYADAVDYGRALIPLTRELTARRAEQAGVAAA
ncbi:LLM class flavin-dependent oxidoreductase [Phreatobacter stygius]|uniref:LLM class flavin-dependent oxidoreductase n=1 Tax=Phreatobacter stygius TaxID=1940610 RepID=A0A4D7AVG7_9HYPH|nr:LLM class flavin-dependent oxidoreductase [Phreatobacter stygius]QCI63565.1 LLM class flavin-dependent oxidoreductase [Phreatobacter stygius]